MRRTGTPSWLSVRRGEPTLGSETDNLVVGNDTYESLPRLGRARADARAVAGALEAIGFEVLIETDATPISETPTLRERTRRHRFPG